AVEALVVVPDDPFHRTTELRSGCHELCAAHHVSSHDHQLFRTKLAVLSKQRGKLFVNLPHVVQYRSSLDPVQLAGRQVELPAYGNCVIGNSPRVARSVRVSSLHRLDHQLELFLEFFLQLQVRLIELPGQEQRENDDGQSEKLKPYVE